MPTSLNIPATNTVGTSSDVSVLDPSRTIVFTGTLGAGESIVVEGTADPAGTNGWNAVAVFNAGSATRIPVTTVSKFLRVRRYSPDQSTAVPIVTVDATALGTNVYAALSVPAGNGSGTALNVSASGTTLQWFTSGTFRDGESLVLEGSEDGTTFQAIASVTSGYPSPPSFVGRYQLLRVTRRGVGLPSTVTSFIGISTSAAGGGGTTFNVMSNAAWFIDPVNGSDTNDGLTAATAIRSLHGTGGLKQRWWQAYIMQNTVVNVLGNIPISDVGSWSFTPLAGLAPGVTFLGSLGPTTGAGGAAVDNTLYTGTVTAVAVPANAPTADNYQVTDAAIPVSYTASGLMVPGVIFRRTVVATRHWYATVDLGARTIEITNPMLNTGLQSWEVLTVGQAYSAFQMWTIPTQMWGLNAGQVLVDSLYDIGPSGEGNLLAGGTPRRRRVWLGSAVSVRRVMIEATNCMYETVGACQINGICDGVPYPVLNGGGARGPGNGLCTMFAGIVMGGSYVSSGVPFGTNDNSFLSIESQIAIHRCSVPMLQTSTGTVQWSIATAGRGLSGVGNTGKICSVQIGGRLVYTFSGAMPPFIAGVTSDATPIAIGGTNYTVAQIPTVVDTVLIGGQVFPNNPTLPVANGAQVVAIGATGPAAIVTPAAPAAWETFRNSAGVLCYRPYWI